jgi:DNA-binding NarL/FixJ family response regulator
LNRFVSRAEKIKRREPLETLSQREKEILRLATRGLSNKDIAEQLFLSVRTVQGHLTHIFNKLQVGSRTEAVVRGLKEGWITLDDVP